MRASVFIVSELYYPEETSTGYLLTRIAEGLARQFAVVALCSQPTYSASGVRAPTVETRNGVRIHRCWGTTLNKDFLPWRILNAVTISLFLCWSILRRVRKNDVVLVVTNPPMLPLWASMAARLRGAAVGLIIHDVYPEALVRSGMLRPDARMTRIIDLATRLVYRRVDRIVVLSQDMYDLVAMKLGRTDSMRLIPNWADLADVRPLPAAHAQLLSELGLTDSFVIQYAGNMGRTHGLEQIIAAAQRLKADEDIHFLFIGDGAKKAWLEETVASTKLRNVTILGNRQRSDQQNFLTACHAAIISFVPGMSGVSTPSRMYNVLAAGRPIVAVVDRDSELSRLVREENVGWQVAPGDVDGIVAAIKSARQLSQQDREQLGQRARRLVERHYSFARVIDAYSDLTIEMIERRSHSTAAPSLMGTSA